jgi:hypothetical protein
VSFCSLRCGTGSDDFDGISITKKYELIYEWLCPSLRNQIEVNCKNDKHGAVYTLNHIILQHKIDKKFHDLVKLPSGQTVG